MDTLLFIASIINFSYIYKYCKHIIRYEIWYKIIHVYWQYFTYLYPWYFSVLCIYSLMQFSQQPYVLITAIILNLTLRKNWSGTDS